jgi:trehalose/maltose transport system substrate-binding protein
VIKLGLVVRLFPVRFALLTLLLVSACGRPPVADVKVTLFGLSLEAGKQLREDSLDPFARTAGIQADLIPALGSSAEQIEQINRILSSHTSTPDIFLIDVIYPGAIGQHLLDLMPYQDDASRGHLPELLRNDTVDGRLVSLPFYLNLGVLYYRTDLLKKYGYSHPPETWNELELMAARIQQGERAAGNPGFWGYVWQGGAYEGLTCNAIEWQAAFGGGRVIEPDGAITVNNARAAAALDRASQWPGTISPLSVLSYTEGDSLAMFISGNAGFLRHWSGGFPPSRAKQSAVAGRFAMAALPAGSHGRAQTMGGFHLAVSRYSKHPAEAARLVLYLTGPDVQSRRALNGGFLPSLPALYQRPEIREILPLVRQLQQSGDWNWLARPSTISGSKYAEVSKAYYTAVHSVLSHKSTGAPALAHLEKELAGLTGLPLHPPVH